MFARIRCQSEAVVIFDWSKSLRRSGRLAGYDYTESGAYFITICTLDHQLLLGDVVDNRFLANASGDIVSETWRWIATQYAEVRLDEWVVMPNHFHGIILIDRNGEEGGSRTAPTKTGKTVRALGRYVGAFKTVSAKRINEMAGTPGRSFWQRGYYDHVIRNEADLNRIRRYIAENPLRWDLDPEKSGGADSGKGAPSTSLSWRS